MFAAESLAIQQQRSQHSQQQSSQKQQQRSVFAAAFTVQKAAAECLNRAVAAEVAAPSSASKQLHSRAAGSYSHSQPASMREQREIDLMRPMIQSGHIHELLGNLRHETHGQQALLERSAQGAPMVQAKAKYGSAGRD